MKKDIELLKELTLNLDVWGKFAEKQEKMVERGEDDNIASFEYFDKEIVNPFISPCGRFDVNPYEQYGTENFLCWIEQALRILKNKHEQYHE